MAEVTKYSASGSKSGTATLDDATFGIEPNVPVMHQIVTNQLATRRAGTQSTKTRSEVRGGGAKPYRQKGTGNARQGTIRAPHYSGGGVALGPKPRKYGKKAPKKMVKLALRSALSDRAAEGKIIVVDSWSFDQPSTKAAKDLLAKIGIDGSALIVVGRDDDNAVLSFRNLPGVKLVEAAELNAYDVLVNEYLVFSEATLPTADAPTEQAPAQEAPVEEATTDEVPTEFEAAEYAGAVKADADGNGPDTHPIKGNADSMLYHVPGSSHFERTVAEVWFDTEDNAEAAGFQKPKSQRTTESDES